MISFDPSDWFKWLWCKLFGRDIKIKQLSSPSTALIESKLSPEQLKEFMQKADLKDLLMKTGREVLKTVALEVERNKQKILNDPKLPDYFSNIIKALAIKIIEKNDIDAVLISTVDIKCMAADYDNVIEFFILACRDAGMNLEIVKKHEYYFVEPVKNIKAALKKMEINATLIMVMRETPANSVVKNAALKVNLNQKKLSMRSRVVELLSAASNLKLKT